MTPRRGAGGAAVGYLAGAHPSIPPRERQTVQAGYRQDVPRVGELGRLHPFLCDQGRYKKHPITQWKSRVRPPFMDLANASRPPPHPTMMSVVAHQRPREKAGLLPAKGFMRPNHSRGAHRTLRAGCPSSKKRRKNPCSER